MNSLSICQFLLLLFFVQAMAQAPSFWRRNRMASPMPLSCTPSCKELSDKKDTPDVVCSCKASCLIYGDCCRDAPFKNSDDQKKKLGCLNLSGLGPVSVVNSCPTSEGVLSEACSKGLGASVPVTSRDTGTTYSNYYCALCNRDSFNLVDWPVVFRCCKQDEKVVEATVEERVEYDEERDLLWTVSELKNGSRVFCECKFYAQTDGLSFANALELRECNRNEISFCPHSWRIESTRKLCSSYLDPVYSGQKIYRNIHCATCNYENDETVKCSDEPINPMLMSPARSYAFCISRGISNCAAYHRIKGHPISFSQLFTMKEVQCIPKEGRLCCEGERYDRFLKKCRKVPKHVVL